MKSRINHLFIYAFFALLTFMSCQDETIDVNNPEEQEIIQPNSQLSNFIGNVTANCGDYDNILDESSCFSIELPVTIIVGDVTIVIETLDDLEELEDLFAQYENEDDFFDFVFPFTIIFNDYTQVVIESEEQLEDFIEDCEIEDDEVIECVDFVYPISFSVFNADFNIVDTVTISNDEALYNFLEELGGDDNALIVSINYPVTLVYANGDTIEVNSNQELSDAIEAAEADCDDDNDDCDINMQGLENLLLECGFEAQFYSESGDLTNSLQFQFSESGLVTVTGDPTVVETGEWNIVETDLGYKLVIEGLETFGIANGLWLLTDCDDDNELEFTQETDNGIVTMKLELDCEGNLDCDAQQIAINLKECQWWLGTNLLSPNNNGPLNFHEGGTVTIGNNEEAIGTWEVLLGNTGVFLILDLSGDYEVLSRDWRIVVCEDDRLELVSDNDELVLEQGCETYNEVFDCFGNFELVECLGPNNEAEFNLSADTIGVIDCQYAFVATFHETQADAEAGINAIVETESYWSTSGEVYLRIEAENGNFEVFTIFLNTEECNYFECFESFDAILEQCDDGTDGPYYFDLTVAFSNCNPNADVVTYYETLVDAETDVNAISNPETYAMLGVEAVVYTRVVIGDQYQIFPIILIVENCSSSCSELDVDGFLVECIWNAVNYNGSDNLMNWNFDFEPNSQTVVIYNNETTIDATWTTSQSEDGVIVTFSNIAGPNIQAVTGEWLVVECEENRLQLQSGDNILVLERTCE
ncbi:hypothetical protein [Winogradskyella poriferorum]|uniref:hypothetical protein n=1 Tax=Winogradskyella poriferorum TaxID=307627 RepID=UPI003D6490A7